MTWSRPWVSERKASARSRRPLHRAAEFLRGAQHERVLVIDEGLHAEAAADVLGHDAQLRFVDAEDVLGDAGAHAVHALAAGVERVFAARLVVARRGRRAAPSR